MRRCYIFGPSEFYWVIWAHPFDYCTVRSKYGALKIASDLRRNKDINHIMIIPNEVGESIEWFRRGGRWNSCAKNRS